MAVNIFKKAAAYRKAHPRTSFQDAIQKVKGGKVSGTKKKKAVAGAKPKRKAAAPKRTAVKRVTVNVGRVAPKPVSRIAGTQTKAMKIAKEIEALEQKRKGLKGAEVRDINARTINAKHRELNRLKQQIR